MVREMATKEAPANGVRASHALPYERVSRCYITVRFAQNTITYRMSATIKEV